MLEFYTSRIPIARKEHECELCGGKINKGERYSYESGKYDGGFFVRKLHLDCYNILDEYCREVDCEFDYDLITDWWRDWHCNKCKYYDTDFCDDNGMDRICWCTKFEIMDGEEQ